MPWELAGDSKTQELWSLFGAVCTESAGQSNGVFETGSIVYEKHEVVEAALLNNDAFVKELHRLRGSRESTFAFAKVVRLGAKRHFNVETHKAFRQKSVKTGYTDFQPDSRCFKTYMQNTFTTEEGGDVKIGVEKGWKGGARNRGWFFGLKV